MNSQTSRNISTIVGALNIVAFDDLPDDVKERIGRKLHDLVTTLDEAADAGDLSTWPDDDVSRCEADHVLGGPCFTPLNEDGTCPNEADHYMLRAGRIDRPIEIGALDREATEAMIRKVIGQERLESKIDFNKVWEALEGFEPAFVRQTVDQAATAALIRTGSRDFKLGTEDFVNAANILRPRV